MEHARAWSLWTQDGDVVVRHPPRLGPRTIVEVEKGGRLELGRGFQACRDVEIVVYAGGHLVIEEDVYIGHGTTIACSKEVRIGAGTMIADFVTIRDMNHVHRVGVPLRFSGNSCAPVSVGRNCWVASKVTIVAGAAIGNDVTVAANAVVRSAFGDGLVIGGVPARRLKGLDEA